ncbi:RES domain-containing protein [Pedobacter nyackensis]|uniref:RES domain-containing protein n=1 Tax=Pedobacter nyackensis TaxID=475255 RepID=UPI002931B66D|nr:RES domain-containing protein [Pedobacter nyackensis]
MFNNYLGLFEQVDEIAVKIRGLKEERTIKSIISVQQKFIDGLSESLDFYYDGQPAKAYEKFRKTMDQRVRSFKTLQNIREYPKGESFYRIRIKEENYPFNTSEMFHIPFHLRGKVTTQRYSIPGFPSLYLSKAIFVAWEELKRPNLDKFQVVRLESIEPISCLNLTKPEWGDDPMQISAYRYLIIWPLIAACSIRVANPSDSFKPEYIIPQMLLQWIRNNGEIDGIIYASTNINLKTGKALKNLYNVVLPVKDNKDQGLCSALTKKFHMTPSVSRQLLHASASAGITIRSRAENQRIDDKIPVLEIIKGHKSNYSSSELGKLEMVLDSMKTEPIEPE